MTRDSLVNTETVLPLVTRRGAFLTLDNPNQTTSNTRTPTFTQPRETASGTPFGDSFDFGDDEDDEDEDGGGELWPPPGFGGGYGGPLPGGDQEGYAERLFVGGMGWVAGVAAVVGAALW